MSNLCRFNFLIECEAPIFSHVLFEECILGESGVTFLPRAHSMAMIVIAIHLSGNGTFAILKTESLQLIVILNRNSTA